MQYFFPVFTQNDLGASPLGQQKPGDLCDGWGIQSTEKVLALGPYRQR